ncbi:MAG: hypothetical protein NTZ14_15455 [Hyphomicrobiales bacterium]|nr:hypothetical protein [Hyphomicrobiales bacterium]
MRLFSEAPWAEFGATRVRLKEKSGPLALAVPADTELDVTARGWPRRLAPVIFSPLIVMTMPVLVPNDPAQ